MNEDMSFSVGGKPEGDRHVAPETTSCSAQKIITEATMQSKRGNRGLSIVI